MSSARAVDRGEIEYLPQAGLPHCGRSNHPEMPVEPTKCNAASLLDKDPRELRGYACVSSQDPEARREADPCACRFSWTLKTRAASGLKDLDVLLAKAKQALADRRLVDGADVGLTPAYLATLSRGVSPSPISMAGSTSWPDASGSMCASVAPGRGTRPEGIGCGGAAADRQSRLISALRAAALIALPAPADIGIAGGVVGSIAARTPFLMPAPVVRACNGRCSDSSYRCGTQPPRRGVPISIVVMVVAVSTISVTRIIVSVAISIAVVVAISVAINWEL